jgi:hypothetical protein
MFTARNIRYELAEKTRGLGVGGIGAMHLLARRTGLIEALDRRLHLLKVHKPYHESDHVLNIAYNALCNGTCLEDIELRRNDEVYLDALGAQRIPDPTTEGDFCRRFGGADVQTLMDTINQVRVPIWRAQPKTFRERAIIDADGTITPTTGECKQGMDISYDGQWGYHPLLISLANTGEPLFVVNRGGNRPSHEQAAEEVVFLANDRCNQENLIAQLKGGVRALQAPVDSLESNWAYRVMASLAWTLKAWLALLLPETGRWSKQHVSEKQSVLKMEFKRFVNAFLLVPCQIVRQSRRVVYRLLAWNPWQGVFLRAVEALRYPLRC